MTNEYDEDYYLRGALVGKSLYVDYRWLPNLTLTMVRRVADHLGIVKSDAVMDLGCARGFCVRALVELGYDARGIDISEWAIANCDETVKDRVVVASVDLMGSHDWVLAKDTLEHVHEEEIYGTLAAIAASARKGVFIVVPLSPDIDEPYVVSDYEKDITHKIRWPMVAWVSAIESAFGHGWSIQFQYRLEGVKDNYAGWPKGNGFITVRKLARLQAEQW
jgi:hypothetical protein